ncbi:hypothetical protein [Nocardia brasiliensis]
MARSLQRSSKAPAKPTAMSAVYTKQKVPWQHLLTSAMSAEPIMRGGVTPTLALVREQWRIGVRRSPDRFTNMEALYTSEGMAGAERIRDEGVVQLGRVVDDFVKAEAELTNLHAEVKTLNEQQIVGVHGELLSQAEAAEKMAAVGTVASVEAKDGSLQHRTVPARLRRLMLLLTLVDFPVILYFIAMTLNVDLAGVVSGDGAALGQSIVPLLTSVAFAVLATAVVAISLRFFAIDLRGYKDHQGHLAIPAGRAGILPRLYLALSILVALSAGTLMAYRIVHDAIEAGGGPVGAVILGLFFSVVVVALNVVVWSVHYRDGSLVTDEIHCLAEQLAEVRIRRLALQQRIDRFAPNLKSLREQGETIYHTTRSKMSRPIRGADQLRLLARSYHQGCGWSTDLLAPDGQPPHSLLFPAVTVDCSPLDRLLEKLHVNATDRKEIA